VDHTATAQEGEALTRLFPYDVLILDVTLPEGADAGWTLARTLRAAGYDAPVLFLTVHGETDGPVSGVEAGGDTFGERQQITCRSQD
jgi:DNA-binding response OmpR family regulator